LVGRVAAVIRNGNRSVRVRSDVEEERSRVVNKRLNSLDDLLCSIEEGRNNRSTRDSNENISSSSG